MLFVIAAVTAAPAVTCLSFIAQMDMQQMACCRHMSDDCDMGVGQRSCCADGSAHVLRAALPDKVIHIEPAMMAVDVAAQIGKPGHTSKPVFVHANDGSPPMEPPGSITILRI